MSNNNNHINNLHLTLDEGDKIIKQIITTTIINVTNNIYVQEDFVCNNLITANNVIVEGNNRSINNNNNRNIINERLTVKGDMIANNLQLDGLTNDSNINIDRLNINDNININGELKINDVVINPEFLTENFENYGPTVSMVQLDIRE